MGASSPIRSRNKPRARTHGRSYAPEEVPLGDSAGFATEMDRLSSYIVPRWMKGARS
jgi:hypothetical protein